MVESPGDNPCSLCRGVNIILRVTQVGLGDDRASQVVEEVIQYRPQGVDRVFSWSDSNVSKLLHSKMPSVHNLGVFDSTTYQ